MLVCSAGLTITEFPAESAGPIFQASIIRGKFQGSTQPTTPAGSRITSPSASSPDGDTWSYSLSVASACQWMHCTVSGRSVNAHSRIGLPDSRLSMTASSWRCRLMSLPSWIKTCLRSRGCKRDHSPLSNASRALLTAKSTSFASHAAILPSRSPVAGLNVSMVLPDFGLMKLPFTYAFTGSESSAAMALYSSCVRSSDMAIPFHPGSRAVCVSPCARSAALHAGVLFSSAASADEQGPPADP